MKKIVAFITATILLFNVMIAPATANRSIKPVAPPQAQIKCLPVCALPALPVIIQGLTQLAIFLTMITITVVKSKDVVIELKKKQRHDPEQVIYREGSGSAINLTPRSYLSHGKPKDADGLSYTDIQPIGINYTATTCEAVNATKVLRCYKDPNPKSLNHWLVQAVDPKKHAEWMASRDNAEKSPHPYTKILQTISVKVK